MTKTYEDGQYVNASLGGWKVGGIAVAVAVAALLYDPCLGVTGVESLACRVSTEWNGRIETIGLRADEGWRTFRAWAVRTAYYHPPLLKLAP